MPSRVIRGEINSSESLSQVSLGAELAFDRLLTAVDDYGRLDARPTRLKAALFPVRDVAVAQVAAWVEELASIEDPPLVLYEVCGVRYLALVNWERHRSKHARRGGKSRFPADPMGRPRIPGESPDPRGIPGAPSGVSGYRGSEVAVRAESEKEKSKTPARAGERRQARRTDTPEALSPADHARVLAWAADVLPNVPQGEIEARIEQALGYYRREGKRFASWPDAVIGNLSALENRERKRNGDPPLRSRAEARRLDRAVRAEIAAMDREAEEPLLALVRAP